jgi:hypothetical protein
MKTAKSEAELLITLSTHSSQLLPSDSEIVCPLA